MLLTGALDEAAIAGVSHAVDAAVRKEQRRELPRVIQNVLGR